MGKIVASAAVMGLLAFPAASSASGAYRCFFIDKAGYRFVYQGRASSFYKGKMVKLCRTVARQEQSRRCAAAAAVDVSFDFVRGRRGFGPDDQPPRVNLHAPCGATCAVGLTVPQSSKIDVAGLEQATCALTAFPGPKVPKGTKAYTLRIATSPGEANACQLTIDGKTTRFFRDMKAPE